MWRLKRYGRFVPGSGETGNKSWKVFDTNGSKPEIVLTIVDPGYLLVLQGQESLDTISLLCGSEFVKVHQKSDNLMFRITMKGESRMMRMQFDGSNRAEAVKECSSAVEKLTEYMPVTTQDDAAPPHNQPPAEVPAPATQHFLGEAAVALPEVYHHSPLAQCDLEPILRVCLLDPNFHAFVEKVEGELKKLLRE